MPIRPENRARYGADWDEFSKLIRFGRAQSRCECEGECGMRGHAASGGRCPNRHGKPSVYSGRRVVLTVAHLCHVPECREHVKAMCNGCHLHYDREHHAETARATRAAALAEQMDPLFELELADEATTDARRHSA